VPQDPTTSLGRGQSRRPCLVDDLYGSACSKILLDGGGRSKVCHALRSQVECINLSVFPFMIHFNHSGTDRVDGRKKIHQFDRYRTFGGDGYFVFGFTQDAFFLGVKEIFLFGIKFDQMHSRFLSIDISKSMRLRYGSQLLPWQQGLFFLLSILIFCRKTEMPQLTY
jgi:hypothetical protein